MRKGRLLGLALLVTIGPGSPECEAARQAFGDFNGDGQPDLVVGEPGTDVDGLDKAGAVHVVYGLGAGLPAEMIHLNSPEIPGAAVEADLFGMSLAAGDFNCDTFDDIAIGSSRWIGGPRDDTDRVIILYGSASGIDAEETQLIVPPETGNGFGTALAAGNFGDVFDVGCDDLAVGAPGDDDQKGALYVMWGNGRGLAVDFGAKYTQSTSGVPGQREKKDLFANELVSGRFDDDGFDDLAVGVPGEVLTGIFSSNQGYVNVLYGGPTGPGSGATNSQGWSQNSPHVVGSSQDDDLFGLSLAVGDFDNNGRDDLAVGVPFETDEKGFGFWNDFPFVGTVQVFYGAAGGLIATEMNPALTWSQDTSGIEDARDYFDLGGYGLGAGDFNGDSFDDLAIGVRGEIASTLPNTGCEVRGHGAGAVNVIYGSGNGLQSAGDQFLHQGLGWQPDVNGEVVVVGDRETCDDNFGEEVTAGRVDTDAFDDLVIRVFDGPHSAVNIVYGSANKLTTVNNQQWQLTDDGIDRIFETSNFVSGHTIGVDGEIAPVGESEWSDIAPTGFQIGQQLVAVEPTDPGVDSLVYAGLTAGVLEAQCNLALDFAPRTDPGYSAGELIARVTLPVTLPGAPDRTIDVHIVGNGPGAPALPPVARVDLDQDGVTDDSADAVGIAASAAFATSPISAVPHLQLELQVPLEVEFGFPDPSGPLTSVPFGDGGPYRTDPAIWAVHVTPDPPATEPVLAGAALIRVDPDGSLVNKAHSFAERVVDVDVDNPVADGDGLASFIVLSTPTFDATSLDVATVQLSGARDPGRGTAPITFADADVDDDGTLDRILGFHSADLIRNRVVTEDGSMAVLTGLTVSAETIGGTVAQLSMPSAGAVPRGVFAGEVPLTIAKAETPGDLRLTWNPSCDGDDSDYAIYEGPMGSFSAHEPKLCSTGGLTEAMLTPGPDSHYYLVVPVDPDGVEGSHGKDSNGDLRGQLLFEPVVDLSSSFCFPRSTGCE